MSYQVDKKPNVLPVTRIELVKDLIDTFVLENLMMMLLKDGAKIWTTQTKMMKNMTIITKRIHVSKTLRTNLYYSEYIMLRPTYHDYKVELIIHELLLGEIVRSRGRDDFIIICGHLVIEFGNTPYSNPFHQVLLVMLVVIRAYLIPHLLFAFYPFNFSYYCWGICCITS